MNLAPRKLALGLSVGLGIVLTILEGIGLVTCFFAQIGSNLGVTKDPSGAMEVRIVPCPEERISSVTLFEFGGPSPT